MNPRNHTTTRDRSTLPIRDGTHEAAPDARLYYNDYNLALLPWKRDGLVAMLDDLLSRQPPVPIHGVGMQMHIFHDRPSLDDIRTTVEAITSRGLRVHFSELDISVNADGQLTALPPALAQVQRQRYHEVVRLYRTVPPALQAGITVWGVSDADTWIRYVFDRLDWPLLFDESHQPKPAFFGFAEALTGEGTP